MIFKFEQLIAVLKEEEEKNRRRLLTHKEKDHWNKIENVQVVLNETYVLHFIN